MVTLDTVWVFVGHPNRSVGGVFSTLQSAEEWIATHSLSGLLSEYPINEGVFDWALRTSKIKPSFAATASAGIIGSFCSHLEHHHYEDGQRVA